MKTKIFKMTLCCLTAFIFLPAQGQAMMDWLQAARGAQHLSFPRYTEPDKAIYAVVRVDKVSMEYEKHGFFRIGALPVAVLEGVTYEVKDPVPAAKNLAQLRSWLTGEAGQHVELRGIKLVASPGSSLEGGRLTFIDHDRWELAGGVRLVAGTNEFRTESAVLFVSGAQAGDLVLQTTPPATHVFLFGKLPKTITGPAEAGTPYPDFGAIPTTPKATIINTASK